MYKRRERIGMGWAGPLYSGEDANGRSIRLIPLRQLPMLLREDIRNRHKLLTNRLVERSMPSLGIHLVDGEPYWIGAWRNGVPLLVVLKQHQLTYTIIMAIGQQILSVLHQAAQVGIVHGDLHPAAIWLASNGEVWIDGFGRKPTEEPPLRTASIQYVSPEGSASLQGDIYSLGVILLELFLGQRPPPAEVDSRTHHVQFSNLRQALYAKNFPKSLIDEVFQLLAYEASNRPPLGRLLRKWDLSSPETFVQPWLIENYPQIGQSGSPEDKIPKMELMNSVLSPELSDEIDDLEDVFGVHLEKSLSSQEKTFVDDDLPSEDSDEGLIFLAGEEWEDQVIDFGPKGYLGTDVTMRYQRVQVIDENPLLEDPEETHESFMIEDAPMDLPESLLDEMTEEKFLNSETTQRIFSDDTHELSDWNMDELSDWNIDIDHSQTKNIQHLIAVLAVIFVVVSYQFLFAEKNTSPIDVGNTPSQTVDTVPDPVEKSINDSKPLENDISTEGKEPSLEEPLDKTEESLKNEISIEPPVVPKKSAKPPVIKAKRATKPKPKRKASPASPVVPPVLMEAPKRRPSVDDGWAVLPDLPAVEESGEDIAVLVQPEPVPMGTVVVKGTVTQIILTKNGRPYSVGGLAPGTYKVEAKFDGFKMNIGELTVESGKTHTITCNVELAMCQL